MSFSLIFAVFWFVLGGAMILWPMINPQAHPLTIWGSSVSLGWVPLVLGLYNVVRWWSARSYQAQRRADEEALQMRQRRPESRPPGSPPSEPNPELDFSRPPPPPDR